MKSLLSLLVLLVIPLSADAAAYLKIGDIKGESTDTSGSQVAPSQTKVLVAPAPEPEEDTSNDKWTDYNEHDPGTTDGDPDRPIITGDEEETTDEKHKDWINLDSVSDEQDGPDDLAAPEVCPAGTKKCPDGTCIPEAAVCGLQPVPGALPELPPFEEDEEDDCPVRCVDGSCVRDRKECPEHQPQPEPVSDEDEENIEVRGWDPAKKEEIVGEAEPEEQIDPPSLELDVGPADEDIKAVPVHLDIKAEGDEVPPENAGQDVFIKIGDIEGETTESQEGGANEIKMDDTPGAEPAAKKPKEIVVVGSKVREAQYNESDLNFVLRSTPKNEEELSTFATALVQSDENIKELSLSEEEVSMTYDQPGRLLGFIPVTVPVTSTVGGCAGMASDDDSSCWVRVSTPWWAFLASDQAAETQKALEDQLSSIGEDAQAQHQQQTLQTMSNVSKMMHDTAMAIIRKIGG